MSKSYIEHESDITMLCIFNIWTKLKWMLWVNHFVRFELRMSFRVICSITIASWLGLNWADGRMGGNSEVIDCLRRVTWRGWVQECWGKEGEQQIRLSCKENYLIHRIITHCVYNTTIFSASIQKYFENIPMTCFVFCSSYSNNWCGLRGFWEEIANGLKWMGWFYNFQGYYPLNKQGLCQYNDQYKDHLYSNRDSHCKDKTVMKLYYLYNADSNNCRLSLLSRLILGLRPANERRLYKVNKLVSCACHNDQHFDHAPV